MFRLRINLFLLFISASLLFPLQVSSEVVDKVVAVVNDDIITQSELNEEVSGIYKQLLRKNPEQSLLAAMDEARERALDAMIDEHLVHQRAKQLRVSVRDEEIDEAYDRMKVKLRVTDEQFIDKLEKSGLTKEGYRKKLKSSILQSKLLSVDVRSKIVISDEMVVDYYDENYTSKIDKGSYYILQMGFTWDAKKQESKKEAFARANRVKTLAEGGKDFKKLAKQFSDLPSAADGGDLGVFTLDDMAPVMADAITKLNPGGISEIIEMGSGYQFFKLLSGDESKIVASESYEAVEEEIREKLYQEKLETAYQDWVRKLKEEAYIQKL